MHDLDKEKAKKLYEVLGNLINLTTIVQLVHWNYSKDPAFYGVHLMAQRMYEELFEWQDTIAEDIRKSGYLVLGDLCFKYSNIHYGEFVARECHTMMMELHRCYSTVMSSVVEAIKMCDSEEYEDLRNDLGELLGALKKHAWFVRSSAKQ